MKCSEAISVKAALWTPDRDPRLTPQKQNTWPDTKKNLSFFSGRFTFLVTEEVSSIKKKVDTAFPLPPLIRQRNQRPCGCNLAQKVEWFNNVQDLFHIWGKKPKENIWEKESPTFGMGQIKKNACSKRSGSPPISHLCFCFHLTHWIKAEPAYCRACVWFLTADSIFQTGDDHSVSSCVMMHREATLSKQLWQANGASRTRCFGVFFNPGNNSKVHRGGFIRASRECYRKHGGGQIEDTPIKSHTPSPPCALSCTCCPPSTLFHLFHYLWSRNIGGAIQNLHAVSALYTQNSEAE